MNPGRHTVEQLEEQGPSTGQEALKVILERLLTKARRFTRAEAGTVYLRQETTLRLTVVQNDVLLKKFGEHEMRRRLLAEPLAMNERSLAGYVSLKGRALSVHDAYRIPRDRPYRLDRAFDERNDYRTVSVFLVPIRDQSKTLLGVLQLINALDSRGRPVPFQPPYGYVQRTLASHAAMAIRNFTTTAEAMSAGETHGAGGSVNTAPDAPLTPGPLDGADGTLAGWVDIRPVAPIGRRLGELLTARGLITHEELGKALDEQKRTKDRLNVILVRMGLIGEEQLVKFLAQQYGVRVLEFSGTVDPGLIRLVPAGVARKYELVPVERYGNSLIVAMTDPTNLAAVDDVAFLTGLNVVPGIAPSSLIRKILEQSYPPAVTRHDEQPGGARQLIIVARDRGDLYEHFKRAFTGNETVRVLLNRRAVERRMGSRPYAPERRKGDRRSPLEIDGLLRTIGWAIVPQAVPEKHRGSAR